jgi:hypothetical protein
MNARSYFSYLRAFALALSLGLLQVAAHAVTWNGATDFVWSAGTGNITAFPGAGVGNVWATGTRAPTAVGPQWTSASKALPFNPSPTANFKAQFTGANIIKSLLNPINLIPLVAAPALQALMNEACVRVAGGMPSIAPGGQWEECKFGSTTITYYQAGSNVSGSSQFSGYFASKDEAMSTLVGVLDPKSTTWSDCTFGLSYAVVDATVGKFSQSGGGCTNSIGIHGGAYTAFYYASFTTQQQYPNIGWQSATNTKAAANLQSKADAWTQADFLYGYDAQAHHNLGEVTDTLMNTGNGVDINPSSVSGSGQTQIVGQPTTTTTTNPDGSRSTSTSTTTNNYNYGNPSTDNRVIVTQTTTNNQNTVNTTTNNTTSTSSTSTTTTQDPAQDPCKGSPDTVGCTKLGSPASGDTITHDTKNISITSASFAGGSCPGPISFSAFGRSYAFTYSEMCNRLQTLGTLFLALSALLAAWIFADGFRVG